MTTLLFNLDGKTIRHNGTEKALHIVSAWCHANQLVEFFYLISGS